MTEAAARDAAAPSTMEISPCCTRRDLRFNFAKKMC
jgi:hypothetical protein